MTKIFGRSESDEEGTLQGPDEGEDGSGELQVAWMVAGVCVGVVW